MELKILCSCGSKYKFDVEPVEGRAPAELACPNCGSSWTATANAMIAQSLSIAPAEPAPPATPPTAPSAAPRSTGPVRITLPAKSGLKLGGHTPAAAEPPPAEAEAEESTAEEAAEPAPTQPKKRFSPRVTTLDVVKADEPEMGKFALGGLGAVAGAAIGGVIYYLLFAAEFEHKIMALGVAGIAGGCARLLCRKGSNELGLLTATFSILAILAAQYFVARTWYFEATEGMVESVYEYLVEDAQAVAKTVPNGTDDEIRAHLAKPYLDEDDEDFDEDMLIDPATITAEEIAQFRETTLPLSRRLASGELTFDQWKAENKLDDPPTQPDEEEAADDERNFKFFFVLLVLNRTNIICIAAAAGLAYKLTDI